MMTEFALKLGKTNCEKGCAYSCQLKYINTQYYYQCNILRISELKNPRSCN